MITFLIVLSASLISGPETPCGGQNGRNCHEGTDKGQNGPSGYVIISGPDSDRCIPIEKFPGKGANGPSNLA